MTTDGFPGEVRLFAGPESAIPDGWRKCDGSYCDGANPAYVALYGVIGTTYGVNDVGWFRLPNFSGRVPVGEDATGTALPVNRPRVGATFGEEQHTLSTAEMPAHAHPFSHPVWAEYGTNGLFGGAVGPISPDAATASAGGGGPHNNMPPALGVLFIIRT